MENRAEWIGEPVIWIRYLTWAFCTIIFVCSIIPFFYFRSDLNQPLNLESVVTLKDAGLNDAVLTGAAIFFLLSVEVRYKRVRALKTLHELRSIAHVIDMHQLTKDPHRVSKATQHPKTGESPELTLTRFELRRYLDYCSEMLSLTGKVAAV